MFFFLFRVSFDFFFLLFYVCKLLYLQHLLNAHVSSTSPQCSCLLTGHFDYYFDPGVDNFFHYLEVDIDFVSNPDFLPINIGWLPQLGV